MLDCNNVPSLLYTPAIISIVKFVLYLYVHHTGGKIGGTFAWKAWITGKIPSSIQINLCFSQSYNVLKNLKKFWNHDFSNALFANLTWNMHRNIWPINDTAYSKWIHKSVMHARYKYESFCDIHTNVWRLLHACTM